MNINVGNKLKILRKQKKITQQELADKLSISRASISNWEIGRRRPNLHELTAICDFYGVSLDYFGIIRKDDIFDMICKARNIFNDENIDKNKKEELFEEIMKLYLELKK